MTGRLTRERDAINGIEIDKGDIDKVRTKISLKFKTYNDGNVYYGVSKRIIRIFQLQAVKEALENKDGNENEQINSKADI